MAADVACSSGEMTANASAHGERQLGCGRIHRENGGRGTGSRSLARVSWTRSRQSRGNEAGSAATGAWCDGAGTDGGLRSKLGLIAANSLAASHPFKADIALARRSESLGFPAVDMVEGECDKLEREWLAAPD